jgi:hypothetical protein
MSHELEEFLCSHRGLVLVYLWEDDCPCSQKMALQIGELERLWRLPVLRLRLAVYHHWASWHGIYGTPACIVYHDGQPVLRCIGHTTTTTLSQRLQQCGVSL